MPTTAAPLLDRISILRSTRLNVVYISDVDLSLGRGPSVNELEFIDALLADPEVTASVVVPRPSGEVRMRVARALVTLVPFQIHRRNIISTVAFELAVILFVLRNRRLLQKSRVFVRISFLPIGLYIVAPLLRNVFHLKTVGDGAFRYMTHLPFGRVLVAFHRHIYRTIVSYAHSVDMVTATHLEEFVNNIGFREKCHVIDNRVNTEVFCPRDRREVRNQLDIAKYQYVYGYVGNDPLNRGATEALRVLPILRNRFGLDVALLIVGEVTEEDVCALIGSSELSNIKLTGQIPYAEVPIIMNALDVGVSLLPRWHRGASEQKVRQYLACGVVPVVTPGGSAFVAEQGIGFVCENDDMDLVAATISEALQGSSQLTLACRIYAERALSHLRLWTDRKSIWSE